MEFVLAPTDKAANNFVVVLKTRYINTQKQEFGTDNAYEHKSCLIRGMSLIGIDHIWLQTLVCLLMRIIASFLCYTGFLNFIKRSYSIRFIANFSSCITTELSVSLTFCLIVIKNHVIKYCETILRGMVKIYFDLLQILLEI